jgi:citrate synthase
MSQRARAGEVVAVESRISSLVEDTLAYRGFPIETLFQHATFEEVVFLLWFAQLPSKSDLTAFQNRIAATPPLDETTMQLVSQAATAGLTRALEAGVVGIGLTDPTSGDALGLQLRLLSGLPDLVTGFERIRRGDPIARIEPSESIAERFLRSWLGHEPSPEVARAFDRGLILTADHELNAATFAARVAASTGADLVSAVLAAIATQSGPLHGGALVNAGTLLAIGADGDPTTEIDHRLAQGERIPGFGHSVYQHGDPRAALFRELLRETADRTSDDRWLVSADRLAEITVERIGLPPNLDLYAAAFWSALGIPPDLFPAIFSIGRIAGWIAHIREQYTDNRLIRPRARYIGRTSEPWTPIEQRGAWFTRSD